MLELTRLVNDIFDDKDLSDSNLRAYADDHLIRLANNNPGSVYTPLITDTTTAYTAYYGSMTDEATKEAVSEGLTITMNTAKDAVLEKLSKQRDLVAYKFGADSPTYQQFFPQGMDEYRRAQLDDLTTILDRYSAAANLHLTADFPAEVTEVDALVTAYKDARTAQRDAFSETDTLRTDRRENRKTLTLQLTKNILTLAIDFLEDTDGFDDYYDPQLLPLNSGGGGSEEPPTDTGVSISGTVTDSSTGTPISGAEVTLSSAEGSTVTTTDAIGNYLFEIEDLPETINADLQVSISSYTTQNRPITLEQGGEYVEDFGMVSGAP